LRSYGDGLAQQSKQDGQDFANSAQERVNDFNAHAANMDARAGEAPAPLDQKKMRQLMFDARNDAYDLAGAKSRASEGLLNTFFGGMLASNKGKSKSRNTA
jgi:hypothetical protein